MSDARRRARAITMTSSRIARETSAHQRYAVRAVNEDGTVSVAQAHWPADKSIKLPWNTRSRVFEGDWMLCSQVDGTLEAHDFSAYSSGDLPS